ERRSMRAAPLVVIANSRATDQAAADCAASALRRAASSRSHARALRARSCRARMPRAAGRADSPRSKDRAAVSRSSSSPSARLELDGRLQKLADPAIARVRAEVRQMLRGAEGDERFFVGVERDQVVAVSPEPDDAGALDRIVDEQNLGTVD